MAQTLSPSPASPGPIEASSSLESDIANATGRRSAERRGRGESRDFDEFWGSGRVGRIARTFFVYPHANTDVPNEYASLETLERRTDRNRDGRAVVLHNRRIPGARDAIDHVVVAPSGVWIIDAIGLPGRVAERNVGSWRKQESRLYLGEVDQSALLEAVDKKSCAVERVLEHLDVPGVSIDRAACFTAAEWPRMFAKPLRISDVWITWPSNLAEMIVADGALDNDAIHTIGAHLSEHLRPA